MRVHTTVFTVLLLIATASVFGQSPPIAITHVSVVNPDTAEIRSGMTVIVESQRITKVGKTASSAVSRDAVVIDGRTKFLIPGLWDMHVHTSNSAFSKSVFLPLLIANGITGVRSMFDDLKVIHQFRRAIGEATLIGPRIYSSGPIADGPKPEWRGSIAISSPEAGRAAIRTLKADGADFVKVYSSLPRAAYFAMAREAKQHRIDFAGHVPHTVRVSEASDIGQKSIEHSFDLLTATSAEEDQILTEWIHAERNAATGISTYSAIVRAVAHPSPQRAQALFAKLTANGTWVCPTLSLSRAYAQASDASFREDPRLAYMPAEMVTRWKTGGFSVASPSAAANLQRAFVRALQNTREMYRAHVPLLAGTDFPNPFMLPGFGLHDELELLVQAGLTPRDALQTATTAPVRYFGLTSDSGSIAPGKRADLVLLDENPLRNIANTRKIRAVIAGGRLLTRADLDELLAGARAAAANSIR